MSTHKSIRDAVEHIVMEAGVATKCPAHPGKLVYQYDDEAERRAFTMATHRWKNGRYALVGPVIARLCVVGTREEFMSAVKLVIAEVLADCPECAQVGHA